MRLQQGLCVVGAGLAAVWTAQALAFGFYTRAEVAAATHAAEASWRHPAGPGGLAAQLRLAQAQAPADPLLHELALRRDLLASRSQAPDALLRAEVLALTSYVPLAWTEPPDPDHGRGQRVPVANIASAARGTLRQWDLNAAMRRYADALDRADDGAFSGPIDAEALIAVVALRGPADARLLLSQRADWPPAVLAALLRQAPQPEAYCRLFHAAPSAPVLAALHQASRDLPAEDASAVLLETARRNPALGSAALLALGSLAQRDAVRAQVIELLGDPALGGSAAQVLAAHADAGVRLALRSELAQGRDSPRLRHALVALQLIGDPQALAELRAFTVDARFAAQLRAEIARGLR